MGTRMNATQIQSVPISPA